MHAARSVHSSVPGKIYAFLFGEELISGRFGNLLYQKYMLPLYRNTNIPYIIIHPTIPAHIHIIELLLKLPDLAEREDYGYEFRIRDTLCKIWMILLTETEKIPTRKVMSRSLEDAERLKKMIAFIQAQYMNKLSLEEIASSTGLSERECNRCFKRNIQLTPIEYLNSFRIRIAAQMLVHTNQSINSISDFCGFQSHSYFGRIFKKATGKTPYEYRKGGK